MTKPKWFEIPRYYPLTSSNFREEGGRRFIKAKEAMWFTNLEHNLRNRKLTLSRVYSPEQYPKYDNYDAIEVDRVANIPKDYAGVMGVPITFMHKYNPEQFEIIGATESEGKNFSAGLWDPQSKIAQAVVSGRRVYKRLFIRHKIT